MSRLGSARQRGESWEARWRRPDGKESAKRGFARKRDALDFAAKMMTESRKARRGQTVYNDPNRRIPTFAAVAEEWIKDRANRGRTPKTLAGYRSILDAHLLPAFADNRIDRITPADIEHFEQELINQGRSVGTRKNVLRVLGPIFKRAKRDGYVASNPVELLEHDWQRSGEKRPTALTLAQVDLLANVIDPHYRPLVTLAAFSAMRQGELAALRWSDIDTAKGTIRVDKSQSEVTVDGRWILHTGPPKGKRPATIPLLIPLEDLPQEEAIDPDALVFTTRNGSPIRWDNWRKRVWAPAVAKASETDATFPQRLRFHDLRHTFVAIAYNDLGLNPKQIQEITRHATLSVLLDTYTHVFAGWEANLAEKLSEARRNARLTVVA